MRLHLATLDPRIICDSAPPINLQPDRAITSQKLRLPRMPRSPRQPKACVVGGARAMEKKCTAETLHLRPNRQELYMGCVETTCDHPRARIYPSSCAPIRMVIKTIISSKMSERHSQHSRCNACNDDRKLGRFGRTMKRHHHKVSA